MNILSPAILHDAWLTLTVIAIFELFALGAYLWKSFAGSSRKWFFWSLAIVCWSIALEQAGAEIKNLYSQHVASFEISLIWLVGRTQQVVISGLVLGYLLFGRNGVTKPIEK